MATPAISDSVTRGVRIRASAFFLPQDSSPEQGQYTFGYRIIITNSGREPVRLLSRRWVIIDADGQRREVRGPGVVGETPLIHPGEEFRYTSFCPLGTEWGTMEGSYRMERPDGTRFSAKIGRFFLVMPPQRVGAAVK